MLSTAYSVIYDALMSVFDWFGSITSSIGFDILAYVSGLTIFLLAVRFFLAPAMRGGKSDKNAKKGDAS